MKNSFKNFGMLFAIAIALFVSSCDALVDLETPEEFVNGLDARILAAEDEMLRVDTELGLLFRAAMYKYSNLSAQQALAIPQGTRDLIDEVLVQLAENPAGLTDAELVYYFQDQHANLTGSPMPRLWEILRDAQEYDGLEISDDNAASASAFWYEEPRPTGGAYPEYFAQCPDMTGQATSTIRTGKYLGIEVIVVEQPNSTTITLIPDFLYPQTVHKQGGTSSFVMLPQFAYAKNVNGTVYEYYNTVQSNDGIYVGSTCINSDYETFVLLEHAENMNPDAVDFIGAGFLNLNLVQAEEDEGDHLPG